MSNSKNKPAQIFKAGTIKATIWENTSGEGKIYYNVSLLRSYKKEGEDWKETTSFGRDDLPKVNLVTEQAYQWILQQKKSANPTAKEDSKK